MITEALLTAYLKRKYNKTLQFDQLGAAKPPRRKKAWITCSISTSVLRGAVPYCSFNRFPLEKETARNYFKSLGKEIRMYATLVLTLCPLTWVAAPPRASRRDRPIAERSQSMFHMKEISLETNPNHLTDDITTILKQGGVNRLSVGVQSFDDSLLKQMERYHKYGSGAEIQANLARLMGTFDTLNVDMIFNFPQQTMPMLERDLEIIKEIQADQVTFYPLMVSEMTKRELARRFGPISYNRTLFYEKIAETLHDDYSCAQPGVSRGKRA